jgi:hypothetical protein
LSRLLATLNATIAPWLALIGQGSHARDSRMADARRRQVMLTELTARLREAREYRHLSLAAASLATQIRVEHLSALEAGNLKALPGRAYTRAFVRTYSAYLGLEPDELLGLLPAPPDRAPTTQSSLPSRAGPNIVLWSAVVAVVILVSCVGWWALQAALQAFNDPVSPAVQNSTPPPRGTALVLDAIPPTPTVTPTPPVNLVVRATERISITLTVGNAAVFTGTIDAGQSRYFSADRAARLRTNNAGATQIVFNGEQPRTLGRRGETLEVELSPPAPRPGTPGPLATPTATPPPPPPVATGERPR